MTLLDLHPVRPTEGRTKGGSPLLAKDFDNPYDYDILDSAVAVLADGTVPLTAFLPNDRAFKKLAQDVLGGRTRRSRPSSPRSPARWVSTRSRACCSTTWSRARP